MRRLSVRRPYSGSVRSSVRPHAEIVSESALPLLLGARYASLAYSSTRYPLLVLLCLSSPISRTPTAAATTPAGDIRSTSGGCARFRARCAKDPELFHLLEHRESRHATPDELALAHDPRYVAMIEELAEAGGARLDADTVVSEGSWAAATAGTGAVLDGLDLAFGDGPRRSFCAVRPPGHHALRDSGMGFCLFGNVAVGAHYARRTARRRARADRRLGRAPRQRHPGARAGHAGHPLRLDASVAVVSGHRRGEGSRAARQRLERADGGGPAARGLRRRLSIRRGFGDRRLHAGRRPRLGRLRLAGRRPARRLHPGDGRRGAADARSSCRERSSGAAGGSSARSRADTRPSGSARRAFGTCGRWSASERAAKCGERRRFGTRGGGRSSCRGGTSEIGGRRPAGERADAGHWDCSA